MIPDFLAAIPEAEILVFDNSSTDLKTASVQKYGLKVIKEPSPDKGYVVSSMFRKVEADYYVFVDGDDNFSAKLVRQQLEPVMEDHSNMAVCVRLGEYKNKSFRSHHVFDNHMVRNLVN